MIRILKLDIEISRVENMNSYLYRVEINWRFVPFYIKIAPFIIIEPWKATLLPTNHSTPESSETDSPVTTPPSLLSAWSLCWIKLNANSPSRSMQSVILPLLSQKNPWHLHSHHWTRRTQRSQVHRSQRRLEGRRHRWNERLLKFPRRIWYFCLLYRPQGVQRSDKADFWKFVQTNVWILRWNKDRKIKFKSLEMVGMYNF